MASELRQQILDYDDLESEMVEVPQWGGVKLLVKGMNGRARARFLKASANNGQVDFERFYPELLIATVHDPESEEPVFATADRDALNNKSGSALDQLASVAMRLSGLSDNSVKEAEKDLEQTPNGGST